MQLEKVIIMEEGKMNRIDFKEVKNDIQNIIEEYIAIRSYTNTKSERLVEQFLLYYCKNQPYYEEHPDYYGLYKMENDSLGRSVFWNMIKGQEDETIVFIHHSDIVEIDDYGRFKPDAFSPERLKENLKKVKDSFDKDIKEDIESPDYMFGRGTADMKGGGSIQLALMKQYAKNKDFKGNIVLIAVPDEENLSAGMRDATKLLNSLKEKYGFNYKLMINSEPHERQEDSKGVFYEGSIGKVMPFIYARGVMAHGGNVLDGFNPVSLMSEIVRKTEINMDLADSFEGETTVPPTWLYLKDSKDFYDVSLPLSVYGCLSVLTLKNSPKDILTKLENICVKSFEAVLEDMKLNYEIYSSYKLKEMNWKVKVKDFAGIYEEAKLLYKQDFEMAYIEKLDELKALYNKGNITIINANFELVDFVLRFIPSEPTVVYGLMPPYYPHVSNSYFEGKDEKIANLDSLINEFTISNFGEKYNKVNFFPGISDLSYTNIEKPLETKEALKASMPLLDVLYTVPISDIKAIAMPCINIGPWGKDLHKLTERVNKIDLLEHTPRIINHVVEYILGL